VAHVVADPPAVQIAADAKRNKYAEDHELQKSPAVTL